MAEYNTGEELRRIALQLQALNTQFQSLNGLLVQLTQGLSQIGARAVGVSHTGADPIDALVDELQSGKPLMGVKRTARVTAGGEEG
jgi:hypothetical protein